jgi:hypothetical protein
MPMKAVGMAAPASELLLLSEPELEPEPEPELPPVEEEPEPVLVLVPAALERLELRLELELPAVVPLPPMKVPLGATETGTLPLVMPGMRVPVPMAVGAEVMELVALETAEVAEASALLTSEEAAAVREETPARSVGTR